MTLDVFGTSIWSGNILEMHDSHHHTEIELNFIEQGSVTYLFAGKSVVFPAQRLIIFWAAVPHQVTQVLPDTVCYWATISLARFLQWDLPAPFTHIVLQGKPIWDSVQTDSAYDQQLFVGWCRDWSQNSADYKKIVLLEIHARLYRLAMQIGPEAADIPKSRQPNAVLSKVEQIATFIAEHYLEPLQIEDIARAVGLHPKYTITLFRKTFGISIIDYITQYRLAHAQRLLATTDLKILDVAVSSGFGSISRFYRVFQQMCSQSPTEYRGSLRLE